MFWKYYFSTSAYVTIPLYNKGKIVKISTVLQVGNIECRRWLLKWTEKQTLVKAIRRQVGETFL